VGYNDVHGMHTCRKFVDGEACDETCMGGTHTTRRLQSALKKHEHHKTVQAIALAKSVL